MRFSGAEKDCKILAILDKGFVVAQVEIPKQTAGGPASITFKESLGGKVRQAVASFDIIPPLVPVTLKPNQNIEVSPLGDSFSVVLMSVPDVSAMCKIPWKLQGNFSVETVIFPTKCVPTFGTKETVLLFVLIKYSSFIPNPTTLPDVRSFVAAVPQSDKVTLVAFDIRFKSLLDSSITAFPNPTSLKTGAAASVTFSISSFMPPSSIRCNGSDLASTNNTRLEPTGTLGDERSGLYDVTINIPASFQPGQYNCTLKHDGIGQYELVLPVTLLPPPTFIKPALVLSPATVDEGPSSFTITFENFGRSIFSPDSERPQIQMFGPPPVQQFFLQIRAANSNLFATALINKFGSPASALQMQISMFGLLESGFQFPGVTGIRLVKNVSGASEIYTDCCPAAPKPCPQSDTVCEWNQNSHLPFRPELISNDFSSNNLDSVYLEFTFANANTTFSMRRKIIDAVKMRNGSCVDAAPSSVCSAGSIYLSRFPDQCPPGKFFAPNGTDINGCAVVPDINPVAGALCSPQPVPVSCSAESKYLALFPGACTQSGFTFNPEGRDSEGCPIMPGRVAPAPDGASATPNVTNWSNMPVCRIGRVPMNCSNTSVQISKLPVCAASQYFNPDSVDGCPANFPVRPTDCSSIAVPASCPLASKSLGKLPLCPVDQTFAPLGFDVLGCPKLPLIPSNIPTGGFSSNVPPDGSSSGPSFPNGGDNSLPPSAGPPGSSGSPNGGGSTSSQNPNFPPSLPSAGPPGSSGFPNGVGSASSQNPSSISFSDPRLSAAVPGTFFDSDFEMYMASSSYQSVFSQGSQSCRSPPLNMSKCSPLSQFIAHAPICQHGKVWAPYNTDELGCPVFNGVPPELLANSPFCSKIVPSNRTACSPMSQYVMSAGDSMQLCNNQPFNIFGLVDQNGCAIIPDEYNDKGLVPLDFQTNFNFDNSVAQIIVNVPQGASAVSLQFTRPFYFIGEDYGTMTGRIELRVTPSTAPRVNAIFPSTHDSPGGTIAIVAVSGLTLSSAASLNVSIGCDTCNTIAIGSNNSMFLNGQLSASELSSQALVKFPYARSALATILSSFLALPASKRSLGFLFVVPRTPSTAAESLNANVRALVVLSGDFCGSSCAAVASVPVSYLGGWKTSVPSVDILTSRKVSVDGGEVLKLLVKGFPASGASQGLSVVLAGSAPAVNIRIVDISGNGFGQVVSCVLPALPTGFSTFIVQSTVQNWGFSFEQGNSPTLKAQFDLEVFNPKATVFSDIFPKDIYGAGVLRSLNFSILFLLAPPPVASLYLTANGTRVNEVVFFYWFH